MLCSPGVFDPFGSLLRDLNSDFALAAAMSVAANSSLADAARARFDGYYRAHVAPGVRWARHEALRLWWYSVDCPMPAADGAPRTCAAAAAWWEAEGVARISATSRQHAHDKPVPSAKKMTSAEKFHTVKKRRHAGPS